MGKPIHLPSQPLSAHQQNAIGWRFASGPRVARFYMITVYCTQCALIGVCSFMWFLLNATMYTVRLCLAFIILTAQAVTPISQVMVSQLSFPINWSPSAVMCL